MPLNRLVLLHTIKRTSLILPTDEKNSSTSLARTLCDSCMTKMVRASRSSGVSWTSGEGGSRNLPPGGESPIRPKRPTVPDPNLGGDLRLDLRSRDLERERRSLPRRSPRSRRFRSRLRLRRRSRLLDLFRSLSRRLLPCLLLRSLERDLDRLSLLSRLRLLDRLLQYKDYFRTSSNEF